MISIILQKFNIASTEYLITTKKVLLKDFLFDLIETGSVKEASAYYNINWEYANRRLKTFFTKPVSITWRTYLLDSVGMKWCSGCSKALDINNFYKNQGVCKNCSYTNYSSWYGKNKEYAAHRSKEHVQNNLEYYRVLWQARNQRVRLATPKWQSKEELIEFYNNRPEGYHVDHIIPLKHPKVSGLHVIENLQYLPAVENLKKGNFFEL